MCRLLAVSIASMLLACSSSDSGGTSGTSGADACEDFSCMSRPGKLVVKVHDTSGAEVPSPNFTEKGAKLSPYCESTTGAGAGLCPSGWTVVPLVEGPHEIAVSATGYDTQRIEVTILGPSVCYCSQGPEVDRTVTLTPINTSDAGGDTSDAG
jgi:hypothetical protein